MINQKCMSRPKVIDVNNNEPVCYPYSIKINKCSGSYNNINDPYAKLCVPDIVKNTNVKVFNLMSRINETRQIVWHETCKCVCRLTSAICNSRQIRNIDKCRCECKEDLINKLVCDKGYIWNPSTCACECDKSCDVAGYADYKNCVCRKRLISNLIEQYTDVVDEKIAHCEKPYDCSSITMYIISAVIIIGSLSIISFILYRCWYKKCIRMKVPFVGVVCSKKETEIY